MGLAHVVPPAPNVTLSRWYPRGHRCGQALNPRCRWHHKRTCPLGRAAPSELDSLRRNALHVGCARKRGAPSNGRGSLYCVRDPRPVRSENEIDSDFGYTRLACSRAASALAQDDGCGHATNLNGWASNRSACRSAREKAPEGPLLEPYAYAEHVAVEAVFDSSYDGWSNSGTGERSPRSRMSHHPATPQPIHEKAQGTSS